MTFPVLSARALLVAAICAAAVPAQAVATYQFRAYVPGMSALASLAQVPLSGQFAGNGDFGAVALNSSTARAFTFTNTSNRAELFYATIPANAGVTASNNTCGSVATPQSMAPQATCAVSLTWAPTVASGLTGAALTMSNPVSGVVATQALQGLAGGFNAQGVWSTSSTTLVAPASAQLAYGVVTRGATATKTIYLRNAGTFGSLSTRFKVAGAQAANFTVTSVNMMQTNGLVINGTCNTTAYCLATPVEGNYRPFIAVNIAYTPQDIGNHSASLVAETNNGTSLPVDITLTGTGEFNPTGFVSTSGSSNVAPTAAFLDNGSITLGSQAPAKLIFVRNTGTNGPMSLRFSMTGANADQFQVTTLKLTQSNGGIYGPNCTPGTYCTMTDLTGSYPEIAVYVTYSPTTLGSHTAQLTFESDNGTVLPAPVTFTGTSAFNPTGFVSTSGSSNVAPTTGFLSNGTVSVGGSVTKLVFVRNTGTNGPMSLRFSMTGVNASQFQVTTLKLTQSNGGIYGPNCTLGTYCTMTDFTGSYPEIAVYVTYSPTTVGAHSAQLTFETNNGTVLPAPVTFTGTGQ